MSYRRVPGKPRHIYFTDVDEKMEEKEEAEGATGSGNTRKRKAVQLSNGEKEQVDVANDADSNNKKKKSASQGHKFVHAAAAAAAENEGYDGSGHVDKTQVSRRTATTASISNTKALSSINTISLKCGHEMVWNPNDLSNDYIDNPKSRGIIPETILCTAPLIKELPGCGHPALVACSTQLATVECAAMVERKWALCGHLVQTKCSSLSGGDDLPPCPLPCSQSLRGCGHPCGGSTCGECRNGRLHRPCQHPCQRLLVCGHKCQSLFCCDAADGGCPPCRRPCERKCGHGPCSRREDTGPMLLDVDYDDQMMENGKAKQPTHICGESCPRCEEPCLNRCKHRACSRRCWEPCDVGPCQKPCLKPLVCGSNSHSAGIRTKKKKETPIEEPLHLCIGMCGEPCPTLCPTCRPKKFAKLKSGVFLGYEDEEGARFIQLLDCGHIIEAKGLDMHVQAQIGTGHSGEAESTADISPAAIVTICCPKCTTPICQSQRYISAINERAADMEAIKLKIVGGSKQELLDKWVALKRRFDGHTHGLLDVEQMTPFLCHLLDLIGVFNPDEVHQQQFQLNTQWLSTAENVVHICSELFRRYRELTRMSRNNSSSQTMDLQPNLRRVLQQCWAPVLHLDATTATSAPQASAAGPSTSSHRGAFLQQQQSSSDGGGRHGQGRFADYLQGELVELLQQLTFTTSNSKLRLLTTSNAVLEQLGNEIARYDLTVNLIRYLLRLIEVRKDLDDVGEALLTSILRALHGPKHFRKKHTNSVLSTLEKLAAHHSVGCWLKPGERVEIVQAMRDNVKKWYKCSQGHVYGVGDCGNPEERSKCPECGEAIGGRGTIVGTSMGAPEMMEGEDDDYDSGENPIYLRYLRYAEERREERRREEQRRAER